jgi:autotransporter-associated beta strand protein
MKNTQLKFTKPLVLTALAGVFTLSTLEMQASDWTGATGSWNDSANWNGGIPDSSGGWAIGNVSNGGTAIVSNTVPSVNEAWPGNGGGGGNIIVTNGGTLTVNNWLVLARMYQSGSVSPLSRLTINNGTVNKSGDGFIIGDNYNGLASEGILTVAGSGVLNVSGGWFGIGNGNGSKGTVIFKDNAVVSCNFQDFNVGDYGASQGFAYVQDNAVLNVRRFWVGKTDSSFGRLLQTGGSIVGLSGGNEWCIGGENSGSFTSYGFYGLSGGSLVNSNNFQIGRYGQGLIYQTGGSITANSWTSIGRFFGGMGVVWVSGGSFAHTGTGTQLIVGENGRGEFTLSGSATLDCNLNLRLGNAGGVGIVNFNSGTARVPGIEQTGGTGYVNFNGATIQPKVSNISFMAGMTEAAIHSGSAIFDTAANDVTIAQPLVAPSGNGVQSISIANGGAGYLAPPLVQIDPSGVGSGATAVAQIDPTTGVLTNIVVTGSGYGYASAPFVNLIGGAPTTPATLNPGTLAAVSSGGLIKNGSGTLTLTGANTYTGPTAVNAGKLAVGTAATGAGAFAVANGARLGVNVLTANAQLLQSSLTLNNSSLDFDLGIFGNPTLAPVNVANTLGVNGIVTVNITDGLPQLGQFPLIRYASRAGSGSFVLGSLPGGIVASLVTNVANNSIDLNITTVNTPRWDGQAGGNWDIGLTTNWVNAGNGLTTFYNEGNPVTFDDNALGTTTVNLVTTVNPISVTANNTNLTYSLVGSGKISGATGLTKQGSNTLTIINTGGNNYTGPTVISGGKLSVTNLSNAGSPSAIGAASAAPANLVLAGGTLSYSGSAVAINRGYSVQGPGSTIETLADLSLGGAVTATSGSSSRKTGPGRLTYTGAGVKELSGGAFPGYNVLDGTLVFDGTGGGQTNHSQNEFWVGSTPDVGANLVLSNTVLNVDSWFALGRGNGTVGNLSTTTLYDSRLRSGNASLGYDNGIFGNLGHSILTLNGTSTFTNNGDLNLGESSGSLSEVFLNGNSQFYSNGRAHIGWHNGGTGVVTVAQSAGMTVNAWFSVGNEGGVGSFTLKDNSSLWILWDLNITDVNAGDGTLNVQNNAQISTGSGFIGKGSGSSGLVNQTGGTVGGRLTDGEFHIGFHGAGTYNLSAGNIVLPNHWFIVGRWSDGPGNFNITGGHVVHGTNNTGRLFRVGEDGTGTLNLGGTGIFETACDMVTIGWNASGNGTVNLNGGSFQARRIIGGAGISVINFNGGTLKAGPNANPDFLSALSSAYVLAGGAVIDTGTNNSAITQALLDGGGNGGLTKVGTGALYLNGANTYTGPTLVNAGTLGGSGSIAGSVTIGAGASLAPGTSIGTLAVGGNLTLGSNTVMEVSKDGGVPASDLVAVTGNLAFGGKLTVVVTGTNALAVNDTFNLFDWGTRSGSFTATNLPANYTWDLSQLAVNGTIRVSGVLNRPTVNPPVRSGGNYILTGTGGTPGGAYTWLNSTNVSLPLTQWTTNTTGTFDGSGNFSNAIPINVSEPARFFQLRVP